MDPSKNTTSTPNNSPPVPSEHENTPTETNPIPEAAEGSSENAIMKTAEEVWAELTAGDDEIYGNDGADDGNGGAQDGGASRPVVIAVAADGTNVPVMGSGGSAKGSGSKKRKSNQVKDPPRGTPTCPECKRQFATWKAAFGHMRKHPERLHRGFFPPPTFESSQVPAAEGDGGNQVDEEVQDVVRGLVMDLNRSLGAEEGSSAAGGSAGKRRSQPAAVEPPPGSAAPLPPSQSRDRRNEAAAPAVDDEQNEEGRNKGFDLNKLPSSDDEDETGEN